MAESHDRLDKVFARTVEHLQKKSEIRSVQSGSK